MLERGGNLWTGDATALTAQFRPFWAQLLQRDSVTLLYGWEEVQPYLKDGGPGFWPMAAPRRGTPKAWPAFEANRTNVPIVTAVVGDPAGTYVMLKRAYYDPSNQGLEWVHYFEHCCSPVALNSLVVVTDVECIDDILYVTKKVITGPFTVSDPPP